jgi:hypothetical protein
MSGGSYNYLYCKGSDDINESRQDIKDMRDRLIELGHKDAAQETESVLLMMDSFEVRINARLNRLQDVWHSVEWYDSSDSGIEAVNESIKKYHEL